MNLDGKICDLCQEPCGTEVNDAAVRPYGQWAWCCARCFKLKAYGYGIGRGQQWKRQEDGRWVKTSG